MASTRPFSSLSFPRRRTSRRRLGSRVLRRSQYALVGLVAGTIGAIGGTVLAWQVVTHGFEIPWRFDPLALTVALAASVALAIVAGLAASLRALEKRPIEVLRAE